MTFMAMTNNLAFTFLTNTTLAILDCQGDGCVDSIDTDFDKLLRLAKKLCPHLKALIISNANDP